MYVSSISTSISYQGAS